MEPWWLSHGNLLPRILRVLRGAAGSPTSWRAIWTGRGPRWLSCASCRRVPAGVAHRQLSPAMTPYQAAPPAWRPHGPHARLTRAGMAPDRMQRSACSVASACPQDPACPTGATPASRPPAPAILHVHATKAFCCRGGERHAASGEVRPQRARAARLRAGRASACRDQRRPTYP